MIKKDKSVMQSDDLLMLLKIALKDKYVILDCGHRFCMHHFSNTFVLTADGQTFCHSCYS
ncbi:cytoplasmic protein [Candidatus Magnetomorum sp. HK-1]|nr:cytoplasmic protein [Candidatus Magnetomorum sp. HK-1]